MKLDVVGIESDTISRRMAIANNVVMPMLTCVQRVEVYTAQRTFSLRSPLVDAGMKKPNMATNVIKLDQHIWTHEQREGMG